VSLPLNVGTIRSTQPRPSYAERQNNALERWKFSADGAAEIWMYPVRARLMLGYPLLLPSPSPIQTLHLDFSKWSLGDGKAIRQ
jgi:hypothetical protein